jgi:hypothetical protein
MESWDRGDLARRVRQVLHIAGSALTAAVSQDSPPESPGEFKTAEPKTGRNADRSPNGGRSDVRPLVVGKVVAEAAMLLRSAAFLRESDDEIAGAIDGLARRLIPRAREEQVLAALCREPARAFDHAAAHIYLKDLGYPDAHMDRLLAEILQGEDIGGAERLPNHDLERSWLTQIWSGGIGEAASDADLLARTCVARPLDVLGSTTDDLYAFTHVVLYGSDMGRRPVAWPRPTLEIMADAEAALAAAIDAGNFDLAAELLWTWPMLGVKWSPAAAFGFGILAAAQDECGFLPGPGYSADACAGLPDDLRSEHVLRTSYHPTLVMGILCAAALRPGLAPPVAVAPGAASVRAIDAMVPLLDAHARATRWLGSFLNLDAARREQLSEFVLAIVLRRACASQDLELVRKSLDVALQCGLMDGPAVRQALALLRRATLLGRISRDRRSAEAAPAAHGAG